MNDQIKTEVPNEAHISPSALNAGLGLHELYVTGDTDAPEAIKDRNGEVVLQLCKVCHKAESELRSPVCTRTQSPVNTESPN